MSFPLFGPWGRWYPWYWGGFGWGYGFVTYDPWRFGATRWMWDRYGLWYDPLAYHWDPYWEYRAPAAVSREPRPRNTVGALRIRVNVSSASVYVDGALAGIAGDFSGLRNHLQLEEGRHRLELRADGFVPHTVEVDVRAGRTQTIRASLKQQKQN